MRRLTALLVAVFALLLTHDTSAQTAVLKIVIIEGEDAVNVIQQHTAVAPIVEVRDRNDQPVAGAVVKFAISKGKATFNGARIFTVRTDARGRATVDRFTTTGTGSLQLTASATFQGQTTTTTISQVTVATAAQAATIATVASTAAAAGGAAAAGVTGASGAAIGSAAAAAGAGGGGGLSAVAIGSIVAGVAGGTVLGVEAATGHLGGTGSGGSNGTTYTGPFSGQLAITNTTSTATSATTCVSTHSIDGMLTLVLDNRSDGTVSGSADTSGSEVEVSVTASPFCSAQTGSLSLSGHHTVTGTTSSFGYSFSSTGTGSTPNGGGSVTCTDTSAFSGALSGGTISGNFSRSRTCQGSNVVNGVSSVISGSGSASIPMMLH